MHFEIECAGENILLLSDRALYWPKKKTLLIADVHLGKAEYFRKNGIPVPVGTTKLILFRLDKLISQYPTENIYFIGDLFHNPDFLSNELLSCFIEWRKRTVSVNCFLVTGNHDKVIDNNVITNNLHILSPSHHLSPFDLTHNFEGNSSMFQITGHVHPIYRLKKDSVEKIKFPCFVVRPKVLILPAFGEFVGGYKVSPQINQSIYLCCDQDIIGLNIN